MNKPLIGVDMPCYANELRYANEPFLFSRESMGEKGYSSQLELFQSAIALARMEGKGGEGYCGCLLTHYVAH